MSDSVPTPLRSERLTDSGGDSAPRSTSFLRLSRDSFVFSLGSLAGKGIAALMLPFLTRVLTPATLGRFDVLSTLVSACISVLALGLDLALPRLWFDNHSLEVRRRLTGSALRIGTCATLPLAVMSAMFSSQLSTLLFGSSQYSSALALLGLATFLGVSQIVLLGVLRAEGRAGQYALTSAAGLGVNAIVAVVLLLAWQRSVTALTISLVVGQAITVTWAAFVGRPAVSARGDRTFVRRLLHLGIPLVPAAAAASVVDFANRAAVLARSGARESGLLSVALRYGSVLTLVVVGYQLAWQPRAFRDGTGASALRRTAYDAERMIIVISSAAVLLALIAPEAIRILSTSRFAGSLTPTGFVLLWVLFAGVYLIASMPSALHRTMRDLGISSAVGLVVSLAGTLLLAGAYGAVGGAASMAGGQLVAAILVFFLGRRRLSFPVAWLRLTVLCMTSCIAILVTTWPTGGSSLKVRLVTALGSGCVFAGEIARSRLGSVPKRDADDGRRARSE